MVPRAGGGVWAGRVPVVDYVSRRVPPLRPPFESFYEMVGRFGELVFLEEPVVRMFASLRVLAQDRLDRGDRAAHVAVLRMDATMGVLAYRRTVGVAQTFDDQVRRQRKLARELEGRYRASGGYRS